MGFFFFLGFFPGFGGFFGFVGLFLVCFRDFSGFFGFVGFGGFFDFVGLFLGLFLGFGFLGFTLGFPGCSDSSVEIEVVVLLGSGVSDAVTVVVSEFDVSLVVSAVSEGICFKIRFSDSAVYESDYVHSVVSESVIHIM